MHMVLKRCINLNGSDNERWAGLGCFLALLSGSSVPFPALLQVTPLTVSFGGRFREISSKQLHVAAADYLRKRGGRA